MTTNTNTPEQSAIPADFEKWADAYADKVADDSPKAIRNHIVAEIYSALIGAYRHLRSQPVPFPDFPHPFPPDVSDTKEDHFYRKHCAWLWKQLRECQEELSALRSQPIPSLRWVEDFKEWFSDRMEFARGVADHDGSPFFKGAYNALSDVKDKIDEWPSEESLLPVPKEPDMGKLLKWIAKVAPPEFREEKPHTLKGWRFAQNGELLSTEKVVELYKKTIGIAPGQPSIEPDAPINPQKYFFATDCDCHWYMIPVEKRVRWSELSNGDSDDEDNNDAINSEFGDYRTSGGINDIEFFLPQ